eukprot:scaffold25598_cov56-Phaeocystis_antarctica.AAC.3
MVRRSHRPPVPRWLPVVVAAARPAAWRLSVWRSLHRNAVTFWSWDICTGAPARPPARQPASRGPVPTAPALRTPAHTPR